MRTVQCPFPTHLVDVVQRDQVPPVDANEPDVAPPLLERCQRNADEMAAGGGVEPGVVALRLDVPNVGPGDEAGDAGELDRDDLVVGGFRRP